MSEMSAAHVQDPEEAHALAIPHVEVVKPETLFKWRQWAVSEQVIDKTIRQRQRMAQIRQAEEWITVPSFAYKMPRLPEIEADAWGFAFGIDTEGHIRTHHRRGLDRVTQVGRALYRYEYVLPRIIFTTRTYELTEEAANMMHTMVYPVRRYDTKLKRYMIDYETSASMSRAVRICYLIRAHLVVPEKKRRADEILTIYREHPQIKTA